MTLGTRGGWLFTSTGERINEGDVLKAIFDSGLGATTSQDVVSSMIHQGKAFDISQKVTLASEATLYFVGETSDAEVHFFYESYLADLGGVDIRFYEGVTASGGTAIAGVNRNRNSLNAATLSVTGGATVTDTGTLLYTIGLPAANTPSRAGPTSGNEARTWVLKPNTKYAIEIENLENTAKVIYAELGWYEHE